MTLRLSPLVVLVLLAGTVSAAPRPHIDEVFLRRLGADPVKDSLRALLDRLVPTDKEREAARRYARMLGDSRLRGRDTAQRRLIRSPTAAAAALREAIRSPDPEIRRRAQFVYSRVMKAIPEEAIGAVLRTIARRSIRGLAVDVFRTVPACFDPYSVHLAEKAMFRTVEDGDLARLGNALKTRDAATRTVALAGLAALKADPDSVGLPALLTDRDERVRAAAAEFAVRSGRADALPILVALLDARHARTRARAAQVLRHVSGEAHEFDPFAPPGPRRAAAQAWRRWIVTKGPRARLDKTVPFTPPPRGRRLVTLLTNYLLDEVDLRSNRQTWKFHTPQKSQPWIVTGYPDGSRLVVWYQSQTVTLYDRHGRKIRTWRGVPAAPTSAVLLDNGDLLATCGFLTDDKGMIVQLSPDDSIVWKLAHSEKPMDAKLLRNGNLLVCLHRTPRAALANVADNDEGPFGRVVEMTRAGKIVRQFTGLKGPHCAHRMPNGHTIVADMVGRAIHEFDAKGKRVRKIGGDLEWCYCVQPLPNGTILFGTKEGVHSVGLDNKIKLLRKAKSYVWVNRY